MNDIKQIGKMISKYLKDHGMKQAFLVERTGLSANSISQLCAGNRRELDCLDYFKICKVLGVSAEVFVYGKEAEI